MTTIAKTVIATGASSGLSFEVIKQLLEQAQPYKFILGAKDTMKTKEVFNVLELYSSTHSLTVLPLELSDLNSVKTFAQKMDSNRRHEAELHWYEAYAVNHLSQHYLVHTLRNELVASWSRIVVVSSGAVRQVSDAAALDDNLKGGSGADERTIYTETKFAQLLGAHWGRRQLAGACTVVVVSPGLIPNTGIGRNVGITLTMDMPDTKTVPEGAASILRAFTRDDFPEDLEQIFSTSWSEWWSKDIYEKSLHKKPQDKWCLSKEEIEKEEGISA
ncbi:hypothetical protein DFH07DRAFT_952075 [Mycena maculata]|uniref:Short-chain dehydrogenase/reductase n=1 Tax=Mycena maculata TaxID=230809 RepID=A0AAD7K0F9_9AGAR|nr:hypothetical protein DFH07DRAFT_952075 [Mycena maculata]